MNAYALLGHACDIVTEGAQLGADIKIVPPGCIYITLAVCGFMSWDLYKIIVAFKDKTIYNELMNPNENKRKLQEYFSIIPGSQYEIHIHNPGDTYNDANMYFITDGELNGETYLIKSGIYKLGNIPNIKPEFGQNSTIKTFATRPTIAYTKEMIETVYNGSLVLPENLEDEYPSIQEFKNRYLNSLMKPVSLIMEEYPGIHYNFACRVPCNDRMSLTRFRRKASAEAVINVLGEPKRTSVQQREGPNPILKNMLGVWLHDKHIKFKEYEEEKRRERKRLEEKRLERKKEYRYLKNSKKSIGKTAKKGLKAGKTRRSPRKSIRPKDATMEGE